MDNIDKIIEQILQDEVAVVIQRYQDGTIRREAERRLKKQKRKEELLDSIYHPDCSNLILKLRNFWYMMTNNREYYNEVSFVYGSKGYQEKKRRAAHILFFIITFVVMALCYTFGWEALDCAKEYHAGILDGSIHPDHYFYCSLHLALALTLLEFSPCLMVLLLQWMVTQLHTIARVFLGFGLGFSGCFLPFVGMTALTMPSPLDFGLTLFVAVSLSSIQAFAFIALSALCNYLYGCIDNEN